MAGTKKVKTAEELDRTDEIEVSEAETETNSRTKEVKNAATKYKVAELVNASEKLFSVKRECAVAALRESKVNELTVSAAKKMIDEFMKKEVK